MRTTNTRLGKKASLGVILISLMLLLIMNTNLVAAENKIVNPVGTPVTTTTSVMGKHFSDLTVDVEPKWAVVQQGVEVLWTVNVKVEVLYDNKIDNIELHIWIKTQGDPWVTNIESVAPAYPSGSHTGPSYAGGNQYICTVAADWFLLRSRRFNHVRVYNYLSK